MKFLVPIIVFSSWIILLLFAFKYGFFHLNINEIKQIVLHSTIDPILIFLGFFCLRILFFIPSTMIIIAGSILFQPFETILLSILGMLLTETIIYIVSRSILRDRIHQYMSKKYPFLYEEIVINRKKYLFITVATPLAPTDAACFLAATTNMPYISYVLIVFAANIPIATLYTFYGNFLLNAPWITVCISAVIIIIASIFFIIRRHRKKDVNYSS